jgi:hypothetical protein
MLAGQERGALPFRAFIRLTTVKNYQSNLSRHLFLPGVPIIVPVKRKP